MAKLLLEGGDAPPPQLKKEPDAAEARCAMGLTAFAIESEEWIKGIVPQ